MINLKIDIEERKFIKRIKQYEKEQNLFINLTILFISVNGLLLFFL